MKGSDPQRRLMRDHARRDPRFLRAWYQRDRNQRRIVFEQRHRRYRFHRRWARREWEQKRGYWEALQRDREVIMKGAHVWWLHRIASAYLIEPDKLEEEFGGYIDVPAALRAALRNLPVDPPTVDALARREGSGLARLLHGACLAELRAVGTLDAVSTAILVAVKTDLGGYNGVSKEEAEALERAVNARLFAEDGSAERFLRAYAEPSLASGESAVGLHWLGHDDPFKALRGSLSLEWLRRFPDLEHHARGQLFDLAAQHGDRTALIELIDQRCADLLAGTLPHPREAQRDFWFLRHAFFSADRNEGVWDALTRDPNGVFLFNSRQDLTQRHAAPGWPDLSARKVERILDAFIGAWPKVYLPSSYGTDSPEGETAYRFLTDVVWAIGRDAPEEAVGVIDRLRADSRFGDFNPNLRSLRASVIRQQALEGFEPPEPGAVVEMLGRGHPATVGQLRALFVELLSDFQSHIDGAELDTRGIFYDGDAPVRETVAAKRIVEWLRPRLEAAGVFDVLEHHLKDDNRCDITAGLVASERRHLLVCEVKGQWHRELFTAAQAQLEEKYTIHPNADGQGVYLILWFGEERVVAGRRTHPYRGPEELRDSIVSELDDNQRARMDVVVLDVS